MQCVRLLMLLSISLAGCAPQYKLRHLPDGGQFDPGMAILRIDPHVLVLRVNDMQEPLPDGGRKVLAGSVGVQRQALTLPPGRHEIEAQFGVLCLHSRGTQRLSFQFEPGKTYRLKSEVIDYKWWKASIVDFHGEEVPDPVSVFKIPCTMGFPSGVIWLPAYR